MEPTSSPQQDDSTGQRPGSAEVARAAREPGYGAGLADGQSRHDVIPSAHGVVGSYDERTYLGGVTPALVLVTLVLLGFVMAGVAVLTIGLTTGG